MRRFCQKGERVPCVCAGRGAERERERKDGNCGIMSDNVSDNKIYGSGKLVRRVVAHRGRGGFRVVVCILVYGRRNYGGKETPTLHNPSHHPIIIALYLCFPWKGKGGRWKGKHKDRWLWRNLPFIPHNIMCISSFERAFLFSGKDVRLLLCRQMQSNG